MYGLHRGVLVGAAAAFLGAIIAFRWLPAKEAPAPDLETSTEHPEAFELEKEPVV